MAGPTCSIFVPEAKQAVVKQIIDKAVKDLATEVVDREFWIQSTEAIGGACNASENRPFSIHDQRLQLEYSTEEVLRLKKAIGFNPEIEVTVVAYCNRKIDRKILAEITLYLAIELDGAINFGGLLNLKGEAVVGKLWRILYESDEKGSTYHVSDPNFLKFWIQCDAITMIK